MILRDLTHVLHSISSHCPAPCFRVRPGSYILSMRYLLCNLSVLSMRSLHAYLLLLMLHGTCRACDGGKRWCMLLVTFLAPLQVRCGHRR